MKNAEFGSMSFLDARMELNYKQLNKNKISEQTTTKLEGGINKDALYLVDFSKMNGVEDLVLVFASMGLSFSGHHPQFETIKHLLDLSNPVVPNNPIPAQPKQMKMDLPKLKSIK